MEVSFIAIRFSTKIVRRWRTIVRRSERMVGRPIAIVLHLKLYTIVRYLLKCKYCSKQYERDLIVEMSGIFINNNGKAPKNNGMVF